MENGQHCFPGQNAVFSSCLVDDINPSIISLFRLTEAWTALCKGVCIAAVLFPLITKEELAIDAILEGKTEMFLFAAQLLSLIARLSDFKVIYLFIEANVIYFIYCLSPYC